MNNIEMCSNLKENTTEFELENIENPQKPAVKKRVRFMEPETKQDDKHFTLTKLCSFNPNIKQDIPEKFQIIVYYLYYLCILHNLINLGNFIFAVVAVKTVVSIASTSVYCLFSFLYSYLVWFQCAYKTFTLKSKTYFVAFLITFFIQFVFSCIQTVGINTISTGFLSALKKSPNTNSYYNLKVFAELIIAIVCGCGAFVDIIVIVMVCNMYSRIIHFCKFTSPEDENIKPA